MAEQTQKTIIPISDEMVERAAKALHDDAFPGEPDRWERAKQPIGPITGIVIANAYRKKAKLALDAALRGADLAAEGARNGQ